MYDSIYKLLNVIPIGRFCVVDNWVDLLEDGILCDSWVKVFVCICKDNCFNVDEIGAIR